MKIGKTRISVYLTRDSLNHTGTNWIWFADYRDIHSAHEAINRALSDTIGYRFTFADLRESTICENEITAPISGDYTAKEIDAIRAIVAQGLSTMGGKSARDLHDDNMSWFDASDLMNDMGITREAAGGIMSALDSKGIIGDSGESKGATTGNDWYLTDSGIAIAESLGF